MRLRILLLILLPLQADPVWPASAADDAFAAGVAAARAGDWQLAAECFADAQRAGMETPTLTFNVGVASFKLGRFDAAAAAFTRLTSNESWRALAHYNLGLTEEKRGRAEAARRHFERARNLATIPRLRSLAELELRKHMPPPAPARPRWHGIASMAAGHDDNVLLAPDQLIDLVSDEADEFIEVIAAGRRPVTSADTLTLGLSAYHRGYADVDGYDFSAVAGALTWHRPAGGWQVSAGLEGGAQFLGGESYARLTGLRLQLKRPQGGVTWRLVNDFDYVFAAPGFDYIEGWRNNLRLQITREWPVGAVNGGYELEINDRSDRRSGEIYSSYSPSRHRIYFELSLAPVERLVLELRGSLRMNVYQQDNRHLLDDGTLVEASRDQDVAAGSIRLAYALSPRWHAWTRFERTHSSAEIARYDYAGNVWLMGLEVYF